MSDLFPYDLPHVQALLENLTPRQRISGPPWIVPCPGCGGVGSPRWPYYAEMHASLSEDGQRLRLSCTGNGRGRRKCSALHLAVALDLELHEFEPGPGSRQPVVAEPQTEPAPEPQHTPKSAKPKRTTTRDEKTRSKKSPSPYDAFRALVQAVLDASTTEGQEQALREAFREGLSLPGLDPEQVQQALRGAAQAVGLPEGRAQDVLRGETG